MFCCGTNQFLLGTYLVHTEYISFVSPYQECQDSGKPHQQQGCVHVHCASCVSMLGLDTSRHMRPSQGNHWPRQIHRHLRLSGLSTFTGLHILSCVGCPPSWLSGCMEWESQLFRGVMSARCYPLLQLPGGRVMVPEVKCELDWYEYELVQT